MRFRARFFVSALALSAAPLVAGGGTTPASALSCAMSEPVLADAEQVFTGRVLGVDGDHVEVVTHESWSGEPPQERVRLRVDLIEWSPWGPLGARAGSPEEADRELWAFATYRGKTGDLQVSACTVWPAHQVREAVLGGRTPAPPAPGPRQPGTTAAAVDDSRTSTSRAWSAAGAVGGLAALSAVGAVLLRRRRRRDETS